MDMEAPEPTVSTIVADTDCLNEASNKPHPQYEILCHNIKGWSQKLKAAARIVGEPSSNSNEPYKNIYAAVEDIKLLRSEIQDCAEVPDTEEFLKNDLWSTFLIKFALIHVYSSVAKWQELCEELHFAEEGHKLCISLIEQVLKFDSQINDETNHLEDLKVGLVRCRYMLIYELTRYAILCSERENQDKALRLLRRAEEFYHTEKGVQGKISIKKDTPLGMLNSINSESANDMFTYVLFYLGQAYRILGEKEKAVLYLHMVLRKQLEKGDYSPVTWASDSTKMASVVIINVQSYETARHILLAAQFALNSTPAEEKECESFKESWADLGRCWIKLGVDLLETSSDRLKDLEEQTKKVPKFNDKINLTSWEKLSLGIDGPDNEFDTVLLVNSLRFPSLDLATTEEAEMQGKYVRDFDEARAVFLPLQKWMNTAKEYYVMDGFAGDHIDIMTDYSNAWKHLAFFEPCLERQIKMQRRRIIVLEGLLNELNPKAYYDVFHICLRDLAEIYEKVYKLKVTLLKERGESLRPKDRKLVKLLLDAVGAHKRNLTVFDFDLKNAAKDFQEAYEKSLMGNVLSIGRILGSISHDHPQHESALRSAEEAKLYYTYFLEYLDRRPKLKADFKVLYDGSRDLPELLDTQIERIRHRLRTMHLS